MKARISGKDATNVALEAKKYGPIAIGAAEQTAPTEGAIRTRRKFQLLRAIGIASRRALGLLA
jgi:hypothetical protein